MAMKGGTEVADDVGVVREYDGWKAPPRLQLTEEEMEMIELGGV